MIFNIELPFFPGLYESELYSCDTAYWAIKEELEYYQREYCYNNPEEQALYEQLTEDDLDFDFDGYKDDVVAAYVEVWKSNAPEIVESVKYTGMRSPRYYNFDTDRVDADVELRDDWKEAMRSFMQENYAWLENRIREDWTSYDGFCSFMENDIREWDKMLFEEEDVRYISTMLGYMMYRENKDIRADLAMDTLEDIYAGSYVFITPEGEQKLEELRAQREEDIREGRIVLPDPAQMKLPFSE